MINMMKRITKTLIKEIKSIRQKLSHLISFNGRIEKYQEFINVLNLIKDNINELIESNNELKEAYDILNYLIQSFEIYYDIAKMKLLREILKD